MSFNKEEWLAPQIVKTPDVENDIKQYLGDDVLAIWEKLADEDEIKKVTIFIVERLDFISHLKAFAKYVSENSEKNIFIEKGNQLCVKYKFEWEGHDYSGVQFDIEALVLYLLLSCIDAVQSQPEYKNAFDWLMEKSDFYQNKERNEIRGQLKIDKEEYNEKFGLSRNFKQAFVSEISNELVKEMVDNLIVVKCKDGEITKDCFNAWNKRDEKGKMQKIATTLYDIRSKYTHKNIRNFIPSKTFTSISLYIKDDVLLCKIGYDLEECLRKVLKELCLGKMLKSNESTLTEVKVTS